MGYKPFWENEISNLKRQKNEIHWFKNPPLKIDVFENPTLKIDGFHGTHWTHANGATGSWVTNFIRQFVCQVQRGILESVVVASLRDLRLIFMSSFEKLDGCLLQNLMSFPHQVFSPSFLSLSYTSC